MATHLLVSIINFIYFGYDFRSSLLSCHIPYSAGDHLTCNSGFSRALKYYRDMVDNSTFDRMITLTQNPQQSDKNSNSFNWNGGYYLRRRQLSVDTIAVNSNDYRNRGQVQIENAGDSGKHSKIDRYDKPSSAEAEGGRERFNFDERKLEKEHDNVKAGKECVDVFLKNNITARAPGLLIFILFCITYYNIVLLHD